MNSGPSERLPNVSPLEPGSDWTFFLFASGGRGESPGCRRQPGACQLQHRPDPGAGKKAEDRQGPGGHGHGPGKLARWWRMGLLTGTWWVGNSPDAGVFPSLSVSILLLVSLSVVLFPVISRQDP